MRVDRGETNARFVNCCPFVVEDDEDFRFLVQRAFEKAGVSKDRLWTAPDGEAAIELLKHVTPDPQPATFVTPSLIVLDVNLPKKSGLEVLAWVRAHPTLAEIPIFMLSSSERPEHVNRAFELRCDSYYTKPSDPNELVRVIEGMLGYWFSRTYRRLPRSGVTRPHKP